MTSLVGILCKDGVVIGADSAVTLGDGTMRTIEQYYEKIEIIGENIILAGTGQVGLGQRFSAVLNNINGRHCIKGDPLTIAKLFSHDAIEDFVFTKLARFEYAALVAFLADEKAGIKKPCLVEMGINFQPEIRDEKLWFSSLGCVQTITDSFLAFLRDVFWKDTQPNVNDGILAATWTLDHAVAVNPGGVNGPINIAVLEKNAANKYMARLLTEDDLLEHRQYISEIRSAMLDCKGSVAINHYQEAPAPRPA